MNPDNQKLRDTVYVLTKALDALDHLDKALIELSYDDMPPIFLEEKGLIERTQAIMRRSLRQFCKSLI